MILQAALFALLSALAVSHPLETEAGPLMRNKSMIAKSLGDFSLNFFKAIDDKAHDNIIFSPFGIHTLFTMLMEGAMGDTKKQLMETLKISEEDMPKIAGEYKKILTYYKGLHKDESRKFMLYLGNLLFGNSRFAIKDEFKHKLTDHYMATVSSEDFTHGGEIVNKINDWVKEKTNNKIEKLLKEKVSPDTLLVLVNAVYFNAEWSEPFVSYYTKKAPFYKDEQHSYEIKMMSAPRTEVKYLEDKEENVQVIALPYHGNLSMYILLPKQRTGLQHIKKALTSDKIRDLMSRMTFTHLKVEIPKFEIESESNLNDIFPRIGLTLPFGNTADFSGISDSPNQVSKSIQKTKINVNEKGTEAAAASSAISIVRASLGDVNTHFIADHPFLFLIKDEFTQLPLFVGEVKMPKAYSDYPPEPENQ